MIRTPSKQNGRTFKKPKLSSTALTKGPFRTNNLSGTGSRYTRVSFVPSLGPLGLPKRLRCTLRYSQDLTVSFAAASSLSYLYGANGCSVVDRTATQGQPLYFDQIMALYTLYKVISSKITITSLNAPTTPYSMYLGTQDSTTITIASLRERSPYNSVSVNAQSPPRSVTSYFSTKNVYGSLEQSGIAGDVSTNPPENQIYAFALFAATANSETNYFRVVIDYYIELEELAIVARS